MLIEGRGDCMFVTTKRIFNPNARRYVFTFPRYDLFHRLAKGISITTILCNQTPIIGLLSLPDFVCDFTSATTVISPCLTIATIMSLIYSYY